MDKMINPWSNEKCKLHSLPSTIYETTGCCGKLHWYKITNTKSNKIEVLAYCSMHDADYRSASFFKSIFIVEPILEEKAISLKLLLEESSKCYLE
jgi:hypothetical protein